MSSEWEEDDTWELLKENKVVVPEGLRRILNDLDFKGIRALAKVNEHAADIESYIRETLGDSFVVEPMTSEEKKIFFGPLLSRCLQSLCFLQDKKWLYKTYLMYVHKLLVVGKLFLN